MERYSQICLRSGNRTSTGDETFAAKTSSSVTKIFWRPSTSASTNTDFGHRETSGGSPLSTSTQQQASEQAVILNNTHIHKQKNISIPILTIHTHMNLTFDYPVISFINYTGLIQLFTPVTHTLQLIDTWRPNRVYQNQTLHK